MFHSSARRRLGGRWLTWLAAACMILAWNGPASAALLRWSPSRTDIENQAINLGANSIATWTEQGQQFFLLKGKVWIDQGLPKIHFNQGLVRIDLNRQQQTGVTEMEIYAEGDVAVEEGAQKQSVPRAYFRLTTRVPFKVNPYNSVVAQQVLRNDSLFQRGLDGFVEPASSPAAAANPLPLQKTSSNYTLPATLDTASVVPPPQPVPSSSSGAPSSPSWATPGLPKSVIDAGQVNSNSSPLFPPVSGPEKSSVQLVGGPPQLPPPKEFNPKPGKIGQSPLLPGAIGGSTGEKFWSIRPRSLFQDLMVRNFALSTGETAVVVSTGVIVTITNADGKGGIVDIEADQLVFWTKGPPQQLLDNMKGASQKDRPLEFYLAGNVEIRTQFGKEARLVRADEVYYDVSRHVAVALHADLEVYDPRLTYPIHLFSDRITQQNENLFKADTGSINASALPYDPELSLTVSNVTLEVRQLVKKNIFGIPFRDPKTGQPIVESEHFFTGNNAFVWLDGVPVFYLPYVQGNADDPLGPLKNATIGYNHIYGFEIFTTWDVYNLLGLTPIPDTRWRLHVDGMFQRGPGLGTDFTVASKDLFGIPNRYTSWIKAYGIFDQGVDIIGGDRGEQILVAPGVTVPVTHPDWRGRFTWQTNVQDLPGGFSVLASLSLLSDHNYLEQYYAQEFQNGLNQETYLYAKQQQDNWAWTVLVEPRLRTWVTETQWLPRFDGYLLGLSIFDLATYNLKASAAYAQLRTTEVPDFAYLATDKNTNTARFDLWQELAVPLTAGPVKVVPYGIVDLTYYTQDLDGNAVGRFYGAGGLRAAMPLSRLFPTVQSEFFNLDTIFHKITLHANAYAAYSDVPYTQLPQLDRFNDDTSDQALRDLFPQNLSTNPTIAHNMLTTQLFDPQMYALRSLVLNQIDTRDNMEVIQLGIDQRWQTKRGFPGNEHIVDWMTLNLSASIFPRANRDDFGSAISFLQYDWTWNIGDRTSLVSSGWADPIEGGARVFTIGSYLNRPDGTNFYLGYRQIDPLDSKAVIGSVNYPFSHKYSLTFSSSYDFGVHNQVNSLVLTRTGKDLKVSMGFSYNSILSSFGFVFDIVPNFSPNVVRGPVTPGMYMPGMQP